MCFSAEASFIAAAVISSVGVVTLTKIKTIQILPLALIPLLFGLHQALEGVEWLTFNKGDTDSNLHFLAVYAFTFIAGVLWPLWIPFSLIVIEKKLWIKIGLYIFLFIGAFYSVNEFPVWREAKISAQVINHHINYTFIKMPFVHLPWAFKEYFALIMWLAYILSTIFPFFISSIPKMWIFGALLAISHIVTLVLYDQYIGSVWCFFAAISSLVILYVVSNQRIQISTAQSS